MSKSNTGGVAADKLVSVVQRIERLEAEKAELAADIREIYQEVKSAGFCTKTLRSLIK